MRRSTRAASGATASSFRSWTTTVAVVTLREGSTPLLPGPQAAEYGGLDAVIFKHQGFNPTGSFKDNGMTCGAAQARAAGDDARGLRFHREHLGVDGGVCQRGGIAAGDFHPARQHFVRQTRAGAGIWRENDPGGGEFRPDSGAGAATGRPAWESTC